MGTLAPLVLYLAAAALVAPPAEGRDLFVAAYFDHFDTWDWPHVGPAVQMAIEDYQSRGGLPELNISVEVFTETAPGCTGRLLIKKSRHMMDTTGLDVIFGPACQYSSDTAGLFYGVWNIPWFPYGAMSPVLTNKHTYSTCIRVYPPFHKLTYALRYMFKYYKWRRVVLVFEGGLFDYVQDAILKLFPEYNIYIADTFPVPTLTGNMPPDMIDRALDSIRQRGRIVILGLGPIDVLNVIYRAHQRQMTGQDYVFVYIGAWPPSSLHRTPWRHGPDQSLMKPAEVAERRKAYLSLKIFTFADMDNKRVDRFYDDIPKRLLGPPWFTNYSIVAGLRGSIQGAILYDSVILYLDILNETLNGPHPELYKNGAHYLNASRGRAFTGLGGEVRMDMNADRAADYWLWSLSPGAHMFVGAVQTALPSGEVTLLRPVYWGTEDGLPPRDTPLCGFRGELCPEDQTTKNAMIIGGSVGFFVLMIVLFIVFLILREKEKEAELRQMLWKIDFEEVTMSKMQAGSVVAMSMKSLRSVRSGTSDDEGHGQVFTEVGLYKGTVVAIRNSERPAIKLTRQDLVELKEMRDMSHENVNAFLGACTDPPKICCLFSYCPKGSVQDIIENEDINLDWMLKSSLISDIANGMAYLHGTILGSHGNLKSTNCLVDSRWTLKISSYGMHAFRLTDSRPADMGDYQYHRGLLWTAPELLRMEVKSRNGQPKGDVYGFGVILQEIVYRVMPYFIEDVDPKEIIDKLIERGKMPFRPSLPKVMDETPAKIRDLIQVCWSEQPADRPTFDGVIDKLKEINKGKKVDIMDMMIQRMEAYAANLEEIVAERTAELTEEKKKTELLLFQMLPASVAQKLKCGERVESEMFDAVSIYFSDIVGFTSLSSRSTPMQVVLLLNDLYVLFDGILAKHDVYKVETIGDAYMVASGLPTKNGDRHVCEIANVSLDLLSAVTTKFVVRHFPEVKLKLRSGFHTGSVASGVVGLKMPRYCLFGETVFEASRMESSGMASRVQCSMASYAMLNGLGNYHLEKREEYTLKDVVQLTTYWLRGMDDYKEPLPME